MSYKKKPNRPILTKLLTGQMRFKRRVDVPMFDARHIAKAVDMFRETADAMELIKTSNELRGIDKLLYCQAAIQKLNSDFQQITPRDTRTRGAEMLDYEGGFGLVDRNGHAELNAMDD